MIRALIFSILIFCSGMVWGQIRIKGTVIDNFENLSVPGVSVTEKGTDNSVMTDLAGLFAIQVKDSSSVLIFSSVGFVEREVPVKGQNEMTVILKEYATYEAWDQKIGFYVNNGLINNPVGGELDFSIPLIRGLSVKNFLGYQTDFMDNAFTNAGLSLKNIRLGHRGLGLDFDSYYRKILFGKEFDLETFSFEMDWSFRPVGIILGYSHIDLANSDLSKSDAGPGIVTGIKGWVPGTINLLILGKVSFYNDLREYQVEMQKRFEGVNMFMRYYKADAFSELSVGLGFELTYYFRYQRNANRY